jgi:hypothetical protein
MTTRASGIRSLESAAGVAALAGNVRVRAVENESRTEMIERFLRPQRRWCRPDYGERHD